MNKKVGFLLLIILFQIRSIIPAARSKVPSLSSSSSKQYYSSLSSQPSSLKSSSDVSLEEVESARKSSRSTSDKINLTDFQEITFQDLKRIPDVNNLPTDILKLVASYTPKISKSEADKQLSDALLNIYLPIDERVKMIDEAILSDATVDNGAQDFFNNLLYHAFSKFPIANFKIIQKMVMAGARVDIRHYTKRNNDTFIYSPIGNLVVSLKNPMSVEDKKDLIETIKLVLDKGASVNEYIVIGKDRNITILMQAALSDSPEVVSLLLNRGANPDLGILNHRTFEDIITDFPDVEDVYYIWKAKQAKQSLIPKLIRKDQTKASTSLSSSSSSSMLTQLPKLTGKTEIIPKSSMSTSLSSSSSQQSKFPKLVSKADVLSTTPKSASSSSSTTKSEFPKLAKRK